MARKKAPKRPEKNEIQLDMTPMIDVVFQLLIFFMLVIDMSRKEIETVKPPRSEHALPDLDPEPGRMTINVLQDGKIRVSGKTYFDPKRNRGDGEAWETVLEQEIKQRTAAYKLANPEKSTSPHLSEMPVLIRGDSIVSFYFVQKVMQTCGRAKVYRLELNVAKKPE